jgi:transketolase
VPIVYEPGAAFAIGKANKLREGKDLTIVACGLMVAAALEAAYLLQQEGVEARVLDMHTVKPLDVAALEEAAVETGAIVCAEEHLLSGGLGSEVARAVAQRRPVPMEFVGLNDTYACSGTPDALLERYGLTADHIAAAARKVLSRKTC